jgi:DNA-binding NarL/FixJ family response regulator
MKAKDNFKPYTGSKKVIVFLVDDDLIFLKALEHSITDKLPFLEIKVFQTGEACLQQMKLKPDVIILDYYLDSKFSYAWNGIQILKQIKALNPITKVIFLSSQESPEVADNCIKNGSFDFISKNKSALVTINKMLKGIVEDIEISSNEMNLFQP